MNITLLLIILCLIYLSTIETNKNTRNVLLIVSGLLFFCMITKEGFALTTDIDCGEPTDGECDPGCKKGEDKPAVPAKCELDTTVDLSTTHLCSGINISGVLSDCEEGNVLYGCYNEQDENGVVGKFYRNAAGYQLHNYIHGDQSRWGIHAPGDTGDNTIHIGEGSWASMTLLAFSLDNGETPPEQNWSVLCGGQYVVPGDGNSMSFTVSSSSATDSGSDSDSGPPITEDDCNKKLTDPPAPDSATPGDLTGLCQGDTGAPTGCKFTPKEDATPGSCEKDPTIKKDEEYECQQGGGSAENPCKCYGCGWWGGQDDSINLIGKDAAGNKKNCGCYVNEDESKGCDDVPTFGGGWSGIMGRGGLLPPTCPSQNKINEYIIGNQDGKTKKWDEVRPEFGDEGVIGPTDFPDYYFSGGSFAAVLIIIIIIIIGLVIKFKK